MLRALILWLALATSAFAQDLSGLARIDPVASSIRDRQGNLQINLHLSQTVPYRVFTLADPKRLIIDFREVDWGELIAADLLASDMISDLRFGRYRLGWSRLVAELNAPMKVSEAGLRVDDNTGKAELNVVLSPTDLAEFEALAGAPQSTTWQDLTVTLPATVREEGTPVVVIDPGHGGIDPGAERGGLKEADLMLSLAIELAEQINRAGNANAVLTRDADYFVSLNHRMTIARELQADLLISLHADALEEDQARGASVYTLSEDGVDRAAQRMAERHERGDLLAGVDLSGQGDRVATVLMDLARAQTRPASDSFADYVVQAFRETGADLNSRPRRDGRLAVLSAADFPSVLVEVGFLSSERDRARLRTSDGRRPVVNGLATAIERWLIEQAARKPLLRQ